MRRDKYEQSMRSKEQALSDIKEAVVHVGQMQLLDTELAQQISYVGHLLQEQLQNVTQIMFKGGRTIIMELKDDGTGIQKVLKIHRERDPLDMLIERYSVSKKIYDSGNQDIMMQLFGFQIVKTDVTLIKWDKLSEDSTKGFYFYTIELMEKLQSTQSQWEKYDTVKRLFWMLSVLIQRKLCHCDLHVGNIGMMMDGNIKMIDVQDIKPVEEECRKKDYRLVIISAVEFGLDTVYMREDWTKVYQTNEQNQIIRIIRDCASRKIYGQYREFQYREMAQIQLAKTYIQEFEQTFSKIPRYKLLDGHTMHNIYMLLIYAKIADDNFGGWFIFCRTVLQEARIAYQYIIQPNVEQLFNNPPPRPENSKKLQDEK